MNETNRTERTGILGIGMDDVRMDRAVSLTSKLLEENRFERVVFVNTKAALNGQEKESFLNLTEEAALVLPGDNNIENAVGITAWIENGTSYQAEYFRRIFRKLNRHKSFVYLLMEGEERLSLADRIIRENYEKVRLGGACWNEEERNDALVNEINMHAPDVLILCADYDKICRFIEQNHMKINARLCICAQEMAAGENYGFPEWVRMLHLEKAYIYLYKRPVKYLQSKLLNIRMKAGNLEQNESEGNGDK